MKKFISLMCFSFFGLQLVQAQKSFKWDSDWISSVQVFDIKSERQEFIIKGKKLSILQLFYDPNLVDSTNTADSAKAQFIQSKKWWIIN